MTSSPWAPPPDDARDQKLELIWRSTHKDYRSVLAGQRMILIYREQHGTCLVPLSALTNDEIERKLPKVLT